MKIRAKGRWNNSKNDCNIIDLFQQKIDCGKLTDVVQVNIDMVNGKGKLNFKGDGYCVTPKAGCKQKIYSKIRTKNTNDIFSKIMESGSINPLVAALKPLFLPVQILNLIMK